MSNKLTPRPMPQAKMRPMSDEEKQARIIQFLTQKREQFSINILSEMVQGAITNRDVTNIACKVLVDLAVEMADDLIGELYPMPKDETNEESDDDPVLK